MHVKETVQIEQALVGSIILHGPVISKDELSQEDFESFLHFKLYELTFDFWKEENETLQNISEFERFTLFSNWLTTKGILEKFQTHLPLLLANSAPASVIPALVETIKKHSSTKKLKELAKKIANSEADIETILPEIERTVYEVKETRKKGLKKIDLLSLITEEPPKIDFAFNSLPVASIGILASPGGLGKSMFVLELLIAIATGRDITEGAINTHGKTGKCTYLSLEDPIHVLHYRLWNLMYFLHPEYRAKLQENLSVYTQREIFELVDAHGIINQKNLDELKKIAEGQRLVVVDTLRRVHSADENKAGQMSTLLQAFEVVAKEIGTSFLLVHHTGKAKDSTSRGSSVLYDNIRYQINLEPLPEKEAKALGIANHRRAVKLINTKSNYGPLEQDKVLYRTDHGILRFYDAEIAADF